MRHPKTFLTALCLLGAAATRSEATVRFENTGTLMGWSRVYVQEQGTNTVVTTPTFEGASALKATQTFVVADGRGYHSERVVFDVEKNGEDLYYGLALYLPPDWVFHDQNVTFQQWGIENPGGGGPWILMFVQNDKIRMGGSGASGSRDVATITTLRGTWIRIVTRINMTATGPFEVWVNGRKSLSAGINLTVGGEPPTIRWANGMYCTAWRTQQPAGGSPLSLWHDQFRVATTYEEAEPANWGKAMPVDGGSDGPAVGEPDAGADAMAEKSDTGGGAAGGTGGTGSGGSGAGGTGGRGLDAGGSTGGRGSDAGSGTGGMSGGTGGAGETDPGTGGSGGAARSQGGCSCALGSRAPAPGPALLVLLLAAFALARRAGFPR
jgi:hypothetical protein